MESNALLLNFSTQGELPYSSVLPTVQEGVSERLKKLASGIGEDELKDIILRFIREKGITCDLTDNPQELTNYIYHDMRGLSFITREDLFNRPGFEELNINAWNDIEIMEFGRKRKTDYSFLSMEQAIDMHRRIFQKTQTPFDPTKPRATADLGSGIRITAERHPIVDADVGVASSIRKVSTDTLPPEVLLENGALTDEMMGLLRIGILYGASIVVSGETGAGKTTLAGALLTEVSKKRRTITIEQGSREWKFYSYDDNKKVTNSVVHLKTHFNDTNSSLSVDQEDLVEDAMRLDPEVLGIGEMRGKEAFAVIAAANTGHIIITTTHSNGTEDTPERVITLAKQKYDMSDATLYKMFSRAFPLLVHMDLLADKRRRVTEIREVTGFDNGEIQSQLLYEFMVFDNIYEGDKCVETKGEFRRVAPISSKLAQKLLKKGARRNELEPFIRTVKGGDENE